MENVIMEKKKSVKLRCECGALVGGTTEEHAKANHTK